MSTVEERFVEVLDEIELPDASLVDAVLADVDAARDRRAGGSWLPGWLPGWLPPVPRLGPAFAVVVACAVAVVLIVEPARSAVANWLGIGATKVEIVPPSPASSPPDEAAAATTDTTDPSPSDPPPSDPPPSGTSAGATGATLAPAAETAGEPVAVTVEPIPRLGPPAAAFDGSTARSRSYTWSADETFPALAGSDVGVVLTVRTVTGELDVKLAVDGTLVEFVTVDVGGDQVPALWIDGTHELVRAGATAPVRAERVLLWEVDGIQYRLEADIDSGAAVELAGAVEGGTDLLQPV